MADDGEAKVTDLEALCAFWNVDQEEAIRGALHLARELIDHDKAGGDIILRGQWKWGLLGLIDHVLKGRRLERIRFTKPSG